MTQGAWRAVFGGLAITTAFGILPAGATGLSFPIENGPANLLPSDGIRFEVAQLVPITVTPYRWTAHKKSDGSVVLSGYEPDSETKTSLLDAAGVRALDASSIADGAPDGFASDAETALKVLALFDEGTVDLSGSTWTVTGSIATSDEAQKLEFLIDREGLSAKDWMLNLTLPKAETLAADSSDAKVDNQSAADSNSITAIETSSDTAGADTSSVMEMTDGAATPDVSVSADSGSDSEQAAASDEEGSAPEVAAQSTSAPEQLFSFAAMKQGDKWLLGGDAPIDAFQHLVNIHLGVTTGGRLAVVPAPEGFGSEALKALDLLATLENGRALFDGRSWSVNGVAASDAVASDAEKTLSYDGFGGIISVAASDAPVVAETEPKQDLPAASEPEVEPETTAAAAAEATTPAVAEQPVEPASPEKPVAGTPALAVAEPFVWQADLGKNGKLDFSGYVPNADIEAYLDDQTNGGNNTARLADGAPKGFSSNVLAGLDALKLLSFGQVGFNGTSWRLTGMAASAAAAEQTRSVLGSRAGIWAVNIAAPAAEMAVSETESADTGSDAAQSKPAESETVTDMTASPNTAQNATEEKSAPPSRADFSELGLSTEPTHPQPPPLPEVAPYIWQADLQPDGVMDFSGYVPAKALKSYLDVRSNGGKDDTQLAAGAPDGFSSDVFAGLNALHELETGRLGFDGETWSLTGSAGDEGAKSRALASLGPFAESWAVAIATPEPPPAPTVRPEPPPAIDKGAPDYVFTAEKIADGSVTLSGDVPADATRAYLGVIGGEAATDSLTVRDGAPDGFIADAVGGLRALKTLDSGKLVYKDYGWSFAGKSASDTARATATAAVSALPGGGDWTVDIVPPSPLEICETKVTAFDERNAILFNAGSSRITEDSLPAIDEIAATLKTCPSAVVHVEGHTDSDGDADSNLVLSVSRAEAVVDKLIALGVGEGRIYAIGYGESLPIASNDTRDGKRRNRRIVITVSDGPN